MSVDAPASSLVPMHDVTAIDLSAIERVIVAGDLSKLSPDERWDYYKGVCQSVGLNPFTKPFEYITLNGKLTLYALKGATDQLRGRYGISIGKPVVDISDGLCMVTVGATGRDGRTDSDLGIVPIDNLRGDARANAIMKAITKAKRRVTLSFCGLGMLDETEVETIPSAKPANVETIPPDALPEPTVTPDGACDKVHWNARWHATVKDTRFVDDETRHKFIEWYTDGACASLSDYLDQANEDEAETLIATIAERINAEAKKRAAETPEPAF